MVKNRSAVGDPFIATIFVRHAEQQLGANAPDELAQRFSATCQTVTAASDV
jgi:hypothetical protein